MRASRFLFLVVGIGLTVGMAGPAWADWTASGRFQYTDRTYVLSGFTGTAPMAVREADVEVYDINTMAVLASGATDNNGDFSIVVTDASTRDVGVRVLASTTQTATLDFSVVDTKNANAVYTYHDAGTDVAGHAPAADVNFGTMTTPASIGTVATTDWSSQVFNTLDLCIRTADWIASVDGARPSLGCTVNWNPTNNRGGSFYSGGANNLSLSDDDGYDDPNILHELGHYVEDEFGRSRNTGGSHTISDDDQDPRLAFSEGFATYVSGAVLAFHGLPEANIYIDRDSFGTSGGGGFGYNFELAQNGGSTNEGAVQAALYDLLDAPGTIDSGTAGVDDDALSGLGGEVWSVIEEMRVQDLAATSFEDFWDIWRQLALGSESGVQTVFAAHAIDFLEDSAEPDDLRSAANTLTSSYQEHTFYRSGSDPEDDEDWFQFSATAGTYYRIEVNGTANQIFGRPDPELFLFDTDGSSVLAKNDDPLDTTLNTNTSNNNMNETAPEILWRAPATGTYYVFCRHNADGFNLGGRYGTYNIRVTTTTPTPTISTVAAQRMLPGQTYSVLITGSNFATGATVSTSSGDVTVTDTEWVAPEGIVAEFAVAGGAANGTFNVTVSNPGAGSNIETSAFTVSSSAQPPVIISEVDLGVDDRVEVKNMGTVTATLTGWELRGRTTSATSNDFVFPSFTLAAGATVRISENPGTDTATDLFDQSSSFSWLWNPGSAGDVSLLDAAGRNVDYLRWIRRYTESQQAPQGTGAAWMQPELFSAPSDHNISRDESDSLLRSSIGVSAANPTMPAGTANRDNAVDAYEDNDDPGRARPIDLDVTINDLEISARPGGNDDEDWFGISVAAGNPLTVTVTFTDASGDLNLQIFAPGEDTTPLAEGISTTDNEVVTLPAGTTMANGSGIYKVRVFGAAAATNGYSLQTESTVAPPAPPDLTTGSDSGSSSADDLTNVLMPIFSGSGIPLASVALNSDLDGAIGSGTANGSGDWTITTTGNLGEGTHQITVTENGGPASFPLTVTIDATAPTLTVNQASGQGEPVTADPVLFTAAFNESVTGFATGDATLGGSAGPTAQAVSEVAPNDGTTFQISVSGTANDGLVTASVDSAVAQDLAGNNNDASTSSDNSVAVVSDLAAPGGVTATDLTFSDKIQVAWSAVATAQIYDVYRNSVNDFGTAMVVGSTAGTQFDDSGATADPASFFYWVTAKKTVESVMRTSLPGGPDTGQRAADQHGNDPGSATAVSFGGGMAQFGGTLEAGDVDYFQITLTVPMVLRAYTTGLTDTLGSLFDGGSVLLNNPTADDNAGSGTNFETERLLRAGTYFLEVSGFGGTQSGTYSVHFELTRALLINEIDADDEGGDDREFVELHDGGAGSTDLSGLVLVFFDGATDTSYHAIDLDGKSTGGAGYFFAGNSGVSVDVDEIFPDDTLLNGTGAVALYEADEADFPNGTPVTTTGLVDAIVYTTDSGSDDAGLLTLLLPAEPQVNEDKVSNGTGHSLQRLPNFTGDPRTTSDFEAFSPTPGAVNDLPNAPTIPDLTLLSDSGGSQADDITNVNLPTFTGTARPGSLVTISDASGDLGTAPAASDGNWSFTVGSALADDNYTISATADKHAGGGISGGLAVTIDTVAPPVPTTPDLDVASDSGVSAVDNITNVNTPEIDGDEAESGVSVTLNSNVNGDVGSVVVSSPWSIVTAALTEGTHQLVARATDVAGNVSANSAALPIQIDLTRPTATIDQAGGQTDPAASGPFQFAASFSEIIHGFESGDVSIGGTAGASLAAVAGGPVNFDVAISGTTQEGTVTAAIGAGVATDTAGNLNFAATSGDDSVELDQFGGNSATATALTFSGGTVATPGSLFAGDMDFFEFTLTDPSEITIQTTGATDTRSSLFDLDDALLNDPDLDSDAGGGSNAATTAVLPAGTYRVKVEGQTGAEAGGYGLSIGIDRFVTLQPDLLIGKKPFALIGGGIYNTAGIGQSQTVVSKKLKKARFHGRLENDGDAADDLRLLGTRKNRFFAVTYFDGGGNATAAITAGTRVRSLEVGAGEATLVQVKPSRKLKNKKTGKIKRKKFTATVTAKSRLDPGKRDTVRGITKTK